MGGDGEYLDRWDQGGFQKPSEKVWCVAFSGKELSSPAEGAPQLLVGAVGLGVCAPRCRPLLV